MRKREMLVSTVFVVLAACNEVPPRGGIADDNAPPRPDTVISLESELLGQPSDLAVAPDGRLWVADSRGRRLLSVAPDGSDPVYVSREGEGPGELRAPTGNIAGEDRIRVIDTANGRVQDYALDGSHLVDWPTPVPLYSASLGRVEVPTPDAASGFAVVTDADRPYIAIADEASVLAVDISGVRW